MFAIGATALLWGLTALSVSVEAIVLILPTAFGWTHSIDPGLARTLFSFTLHTIVYFWLLLAYIAYYTMLPRAAGGRFAQALDPVRAASGRSPRVKPLRSR